MSNPPGQPPQPPYQPPQLPYQQQQPYQQPPYGQPPLPPASGGGGAFKWILIGVGVLVLLVVGTFTIGGYFLYRTAKNAGLDPDLMKKNPGLAMARMATALNPDVEVMSTNESSGTITVREKSTGKTITMRFDLERKSMVVVDDQGKEAEVKISGDEKTGSLDITTSDGTLKIGSAAGNSTPSWVPVYPGAAPQGTMSSQNADGNQATFSFKTKDSAGQVLTFYENQLKSAGFNIPMNAKSDQGGMLSAESVDKKRVLLITAGSSPEGTEGSITAVEKK